MAIEYTTSSEAVKIVESGNRVFVQGCAATPVSLLNALLERAGEINNVELVAISTYGNIDWNRPEVLKSFYLNSLFVSGNIRKWANSSHGNYVPIFLSEIPALFDRNILPLDVALIQVSPPDQHGYCTLGTSVDVALAAVRNAKKIIALVNPNMPRVHGDGFVHLSRFSKIVWEENELFEEDFSAGADDVAKQIGRYVAELVEDGSTLQMGIGSVPDSVLQCLQNHKGLGVHTEMFSDGLLPLVEKGVITNEFKRIQRRKIVSTFILGSKKVYEFANDNPNVCLMDVGFVNDTSVIRRNPKVVSINSAIELDLTGQICADSIGTLQYSAISSAKARRRTSFRP